MERVELVYKDMSEIVGSDGFTIVRLTDADEQRALCIICDKLISDQLNLRFTNVPGREQMLPEVLWAMLKEQGLSGFELMITGIEDGHYCVVLINRHTLSYKPIRMSDAVLLHVISRVPIFISNDLMNRQCSAYTPGATGISIPINTMGMKQLNKELARAIEAEDYRLASHLHEEITRRRHQ